MDDQSEVQSYILQKSDDGKTFSTLIHMNLLIDKLQSDYKHTDNHASPGDNYYRVAAISKNGDWIYSNIAKVVSVVTDPGICVYPNPVVDKKMTLAFTKQSFGTYAVRMVNSLGQVVLTQNENISSVTTMKDITIPVSVGTGNYRLTITAPDGTITNKQIFIQQ